MVLKMTGNAYEEADINTYQLRLWLWQSWIWWSELC